MTEPGLFYTAKEVAEMFRLTVIALNSQRKRGIEPGALAVKVGGKYLYPKNLIDRYLDGLAKDAQAALGLDDSLTAEIFGTPPANNRVLTLSEAARRLDTDPKVLVAQWESDTFPGALGWRVAPGAEIVFTPRDLDVWVQVNANQDRKDVPSARPD
jgi:hypothetical protein